MPVYQTNNNTLLQIKEKKLHRKNLAHNELNTNYTNIYIYIERESGGR